ncbi:hypothetical protein PHYBLDRAFT_139104 [Phycomyces blakesleeanus NRRL 1555(-)]|uniref:Uncharacterized protein n=1 Tax=Phycomyces blakesleeanus (strain ATCC 8743b / DSM 1359 / FGSC 10004 / NBRC 33097 / NRRL 1555) TaxID=763407 RepID=A0A167RFY3_PHYB8|nr:hypothetical protein PHYBLDRAFT_139104 [Phycomyces blakesleeanus NRRL 1555(-)]OAD81559.1 hypothetical protein PHYBLDRAFT_139104 [Phycomyces blakesleeanus NRRL 1555(-)]|eukprot:XP_018299599.1 hypothetical protein PHYBLDRAFT_139104 [Phycomyces blakesleeanus NRRL 1555(-)]
MTKIQSASTSATTTTNTNINMTNIHQEAVNEVNEFLDTCYVLASEACWRIFSFKLHQEHPTHQRLAIHLENSQPVYFYDSTNRHQLSNANINTTLTDATSFQNLWTVEGQLYETNQAACQALGLLIDDKEWEKCMEEAKSYELPYSLR